jgi:hypothetical protein
VRKSIVILYCLAVTGCASFQAFLERDEATVESWRQGNVDQDRVCVVVGEQCRFVPREAYDEEKKAIDAAARHANAEWRKSRPMAADLVNAH